MAQTNEPIVKFSEVTKRYGDLVVLDKLDLEIKKNEMISIIGPSGSGKTTVLRVLMTLEKINSGVIYVDGEPLTHMLSSGELIEANEKYLRERRSKIGMVFQKPNPFPKSIYDNVAFGPKLHGMVKSKGELDNIVVQSLSKSGLYDEVKDRLFEPGTSLSGGQQQRLCIARALAVNPEILLMDEPCSALDPIATAKIEDLIAELKQQYTIVIVTHSMQQAARVSDRTAYMHMGELIETGMTKSIFSNPQHEKTQDYITGRIG